jgi:cytochrome P450
LLQPFPSLTARKPIKGRAELQKALRAYFRAGYDQNSDVSVVIKNRVAINKKWGLPIDDAADHELGMMFVSVTNAIPTLFWMIFYVFHDPQLVADLQKELLETMEEREDAMGQRECIFNITKFSTACPLLVSTYQEVMRVTNRQLGTRTVLEDTYLSYTPVGEAAGTPITYLLKKGVHIQMPSKVTSYASATWGTNAHIFDPRRFITSKEKERKQKKSFTPFGGGKHLCPGRHFAYAEILGTTAALVLGFEILTPEGGRVTVPPINDSLVEAVGKPLQAVQQNLLAKIRRRPGWEGVKWRFIAANGTEVNVSKNG